MTDTETKVEAQDKNSPTDKELNFRALENRYETQLQKLMAEREAMQQQLEQLQKMQTTKEEDDEEDLDPYIDRKKFKKGLEKFGEKTLQHTQKAVQTEVQKAIQEERKNQWLNQHPDFYEVLQKHAEEFAQKAPMLAEAILKMPDSFERHQLVYANIKELGLGKSKEPSIQEQIQQNKRTPYYQPSNVAMGSPNRPTGDFSKSGQKFAYEQMQALKQRLPWGG